MGTQAQRVKRMVYRDGPFKVRFKLIREDGEYLTSSDVDSITYRIERSILNRSNQWEPQKNEQGQTVHYDVTVPTIAILDDPVACYNDDGDEDYYNFEYIFPTDGASLFPQRNRQYLITFRLELSDGNISVPPEILCQMY